MPPSGYKDDVCDTFDLIISLVHGQSLALSSFPIKVVVGQARGGLGKNKLGDRVGSAYR